MSEVISTSMIILVTNYSGQTSSQYTIKHLQYVSPS